MAAGSRPRAFIGLQCHASALPVGVLIKAAVAAKVLAPCLCCMQQHLSELALPTAGFIKLTVAVCCSGISKHQAHHTF